MTAQLLKGNALAGLKDPDRAIEQINEAIKLDPTDARSYAALGTIELSKGRRDEAEAAFKRAVEAQPSSSLAQLSLANFYWSAGRLAEAEPILKQAVALDPQNVAVQRALATYYLSTGRAKEAEAPLKAVADTVKNMQSRLALADYYLGDPANGRRQNPVDSDRRRKGRLRRRHDPPGRPGLRGSPRRGGAPPD